MKKFLLILVALVFANVLSAQNSDSRLHVRKIELIPNDTEASRAKKIDENRETCALIKIQTPNMDEAERNKLVIDADRGTFVYPEPAVGELKIFLTQGVKILVIKHPDYGVLNYEVKEHIEGNKVYKLVLEADKSVQTGPQTVQINSNWVVVKMKPADAVVTIDGKLCSNGKAMLSTDEPHELVATHPYYHTFEKTINASANEKMTYSFEMAPAFGWLIITSKPENGATVMINNKKVGVTPYRSDTLASGEYEVTLLKDMYETETRTVNVRDKNEGEIEIHMKATFANIKVVTDNESDIYVDDTPRGKGTWTGRLGEGEHIVEARKTSHRNSIKKIDVVAGRNESVTVANPVPIYGALNLNSTPDEAFVYLDGVKIGETPLIKNNVLIGPHTLKFEKQGCAPLTKTITVAENQMLNVDEKLVTGREISISTDKNGDKVFVDGNYIGESPLTATLSFGEHEITAIRGYNGDINALKDLNGGTFKGLNAINGVNGIKATAKTMTVSQTGGENSVKLTFSTGAISGVFSVSSSKKVHFSQGNLQYQASTKTWRFAEHQWDIIGDANKNISSSYSGWIDLFGWGTSGYNGKNPWMTSNESTDYGNGNTDIAGTNYDWGVYNTISNGGGKSWRTLTRDEWVYVFDKRNTGSGIRYAKAIVNGVKGVILLPDNWYSSNYSLSNTNKTDASFGSNRINQTDWANKFEANGAVFLPAAGYRGGTSVRNVGSYGGYWSAKNSGSDDARYVHFDDGDLGAEYWWIRWVGRSVRLVCSAEN